MPVHVVGSGPLTLVEAGDAPEETYYRFYVMPAESLEATAERSLANLGLWPDMIVLAFDERALAPPMSREEEATARGLIRSVAEGAENAAAVTVLLNFRVPEGEAAGYRARVERMNAWMREDLCRGGENRHCVDIGSDGGDANRVRLAVSRGVSAARADADELRRFLITWR